MSGDLEEPTIENVRARLQKQIDYEHLVADEEGIIGRYACLLDDWFTVADIHVLLREIDRLKAES